MEKEREEREEKYKKGDRSEEMIMKEMTDTKKRREKEG